MARKGEPLKKADKVEKERRIEQAVIALLEGSSVQGVVRSFMTQYDLSQPTAYEYTKEATERIHQKIEQNIEQHIGKQYRRLERLYERAMNVNDLRTARQIIKDQAELLGLDAPKRTDITSGGEPIPLEIRMINVGDSSSDNE